MKMKFYQLFQVVILTLVTTSIYSQSANYSNWEIASSELASGKLVLVHNQTRTFNFSVTIARFLNSSGTDFDPVNFQFRLDRLPSGSASCGCTAITSTYSITTSDFASGSGITTKNFSATVTGQSGSSPTGSTLRNNDKILLTILTNGPWAPNKTFSVTVLMPISDNTISYSGTTSFIGSGDPSTITGSTPTGGTGSYTYQWQLSTTSSTTGFSNIASATGINYNPPTIFVTTHYRRVVTSGALSNNSNPITINITIPPISNNSISNSGNSTFYGTSGDPSLLNGSTPTGGSGSYSYQWQSSTTSASSGFTNIGSANSSSYDPPAIVQTTHYKRVVTSGGLSHTSNVITIDLRPIGSTLEHPIDYGDLDIGFGFSDNRSLVGYGDDYGSSFEDIFYKFNLTEAAKASIYNCKSDGTPTIYYLLDSNGNLVTGGETIESCDVGIQTDFDLQPGVYYIVNENMDPWTVTANIDLYLFNIESGKISNNSTVHYRSNSLFVNPPERNGKIIYPNPANQYIQFSLSESKDAFVQITSLNGVILDEARLTRSSNRMDVSHLTSGLYIVRIFQENNVHLEKVLVQNR